MINVIQLENVLIDSGDGVVSRDVASKMEIAPEVEFPTQ